MATEKILNGWEITCIFLCENTLDEIEFVLMPQLSSMHRPTILNAIRQMIAQVETFKETARRAGLASYGGTEQTSKEIEKNFSVAKETWSAAVAQKKTSSK